MIRSPHAAALAALALAAASCGGRLVPSPVEGEPVCADFVIGATQAKMRGSLRHPVVVTIMEGEKPISRATLLGGRSKDDAGGRVLIPDDDGEYEVRWAQCENERAPRPVTGGLEAKEAAQYECGSSEVYKTEKLTTKKGDAASRKLTFAAPPRPECWASETPKPPEPPPTAAPAAEPPDAGAEPPDAATPDAAVPDAGEADASKKKPKAP